MKLGLSRRQFADGLTHHYFLAMRDAIKPSVAC